MATKSEITKLENRISKLMKNPDKNQRQALDIFKKLNNMDIPLEILTSTTIAPKINEFRKICKDSETKCLGKTLLKKWINLNNNATIRNNNLNNGDIGQDNARKCENKKKVKKAKVEKKEKIKTPPGNASKTKLNNCNEDLRNKCRKMLFDALSTGNENFTNINIKQLADELEECIFCVFKNTGQNYKDRVISRAFNLQDPNNPILQTKFLSGSITPANMAVLTHEEMASDEKNRLRALYRKEGMNKSHMATVSGTSTYKRYAM